MKKIMLIQIFLVFLIFSGLSAQDKINEEEVKSALTKIFDLSKEQNYAEAAKLLLYSRNEVRSFNFSDKSEAKRAKRLVKKIKAYLDLSDSYEYESLTLGTMQKLESADLKVNFKSGDQELTISFLFVKHANKLLLAHFK